MNVPKLLIPNTMLCAVIFLVRTEAQETLETVATP
jgi:hypothetical protein